jgi:hypothetical protein
LAAGEKGVPACFAVGCAPHNADIAALRKLQILDKKVMKRQRPGSFFCHPISEITEEFLHIDARRAKIPAGSALKTRPYDTVEMRLPSSSGMGNIDTTASLTILTGYCRMLCINSHLS